MCQFAAILEKIREHLPDLMIKEGEPLKNHTSFRIGGPCRLMLRPQSVEELRKALLILQQYHVKPIILGSGTNVLAPDKGIDGIVVLTKGMNTIRKTGETILAACCGVQMARLATFAMEQGLTGLEFAHGIPGTVGGGVFMNAGAYGGEIRQVAVRTSFLFWDGSIREYSGAEQGFRYRGSVFQEAGGVILETEFSLRHGEREEIRARMQELAERRRSKPAAGPAFSRFHVQAARGFFCRHVD